MTYNDYPKAAVNNAKRALKYMDESGNPKGCGTPVGWARANQLANGEGLSYDTIKRMAAFIRHEQNKDIPYDEGCGGLMWDAWGGDEGIEWAIRKVDKIERELEDPKISFDYDGVLTTEAGKRLAKSKAEEYKVYIISARRSEDSLMAVAKELNIPMSRVFATGSNKAKIEKILELGITTHYDNNKDVIEELEDRGELYAST